MTTLCILAIETASDACSVALLCDARVRSVTEWTPKEHARRLLPIVDGLLREGGLRLADLDAIAFGRGPGSFTGLRLAASVAQGLAFGAGLPVVPVSTLAALAQRAPAARVAVAVDARMDQVYWGVFVRDDQGIAQLVAPERVVAAADVALPPGDWSGVGSGWARYARQFTPAVSARVLMPVAEALPDARGVLAIAEVMVRAGQVLAADEALPVYLRNDVAKKPISPQ